MNILKSITSFSQQQTQIFSVNVINGEVKKEKTFSDLSGNTQLYLFFNKDNISLSTFKSFLKNEVIIDNFYKINFNGEDYEGKYFCNNYCYGNMKNNVKNSGKEELRRLINEKIESGKVIISK